QRRAQHLFQPPNCLADGGTREAQPVGCGPKIPLLCHQDEDRESIEIRLHWLTPLSTVEIDKRLIATMGDVYLPGNPLQGGLQEGVEKWTRLFSLPAHPAASVL